MIQLINYREYFCLKVLASWCLVLTILCLCIVYSTRGWAVGDVIDCYGDSSKGHQNFKENFDRNPGDLIATYNLGINYLCMDRLSEGIQYIQLASDRGHIQATYLMAVFYESDGTFDSQHEVTKKNIDQTIYYYNKADQQIKNAIEYPYGIHEDMYYLENRNHTRAQVAVNLPCMYFNQYSQQLYKMKMHQNQSSIEDIDPKLQLDMFRSLISMREFSQKCLNEPLPPAWLADEIHIREVEQIQCQAMNEFANYALSAEIKRRAIKKQCQESLGACSAYINITSQLIEKFHIMRNQVLSVSFF